MKPFNFLMYNLWLQISRQKFLSSCLLFLAGFYWAYGTSLHAADNGSCLECHSDIQLTTERGGKTISLYVNESGFQKSVHHEQDCINCHPDAEVDEFPHPEKLEPVYCGNCHEDAQLDFDASVHGMAFKRQEIYAPDCSSCHGKHNILSSRDTESPTFKMQVPFLCGKCHREGAPVANVYQISEKNILENYSQSIHGEGLFKKGLIVTATCNDCHKSHMILPHTNPGSSVASRNVARMCMKCHARIEQVHVKVIRGELWEAQPGAIPICTDCHLAHKARKEAVEIGIADRSCLNCHQRPEIHKVDKGERVSLTIREEDLTDSQHRNIPCVKCHSDVNPVLKRPCTTAGKVDCSSCHAKVSEEYFASGHGQNYLQHKQDVPYCSDCHGDHKVKSHLDESAPTFRSAVPALCGNCHKEGGKGSGMKEVSQSNAFADYSTSVHGRGLTQKGLLPSAICIDCHGTHMIFGSEDERSSVSHDNVPATCSTCHRGIFKEFIKSVHFSPGLEEKQKLPTCSDCHSSHTISSVVQDQFLHQVTIQCGSCHASLAESYFQTMHGKAYTLGYLKAARCSDCHGAHDIMEINNSASRVSYRNVVSTCQKCHADANRQFTGYLTHATHHDKVKYPILYYTYWAMTSLLIGVFGFFGLHTLLWLPRSIRQMRKRKQEKSSIEGRYYIRRFTTPQRITHIFVIISFVLLALTGMMLKFSTLPWADYLSRLFGGVYGAGIVHRIAAVITFGYFSFHLYSLIRQKIRTRVSLIQFIFSNKSLMFNRQDLKDFWGTIKWFFGAGPRPEYGRWTYWEKFDYFAVFWGVAVIGFSGLIQWFPEYSTLILPGWLINVAAIIHSDEALLAVGFIFTIHFFNTHLRPEAFPMDKVIFTGLVPVDEYKSDRPREYQELKDSGELRKRLVMGGMSEQKEQIVTIFGYTALGIGVSLIGLIIYSMLFGYK